MTGPAPLSWFGIVRIGLVQAALGAIVVLCTSTLNRVMVVELALPATLPGLLVGLHYAVQCARPRFGHGSDRVGRRTPWIVGGMAVLALGGALAAAAVGWMAHYPVAGLLAAAAAFLLIGVGVGAAGTTLLVLLAKRVAPRRRAAAATVTWVMMIVGFIVTTAVVGRLLDPYSPERLLAIAASVCAIAFVVSTLAVIGLEGDGGGAQVAAQTAPTPFRAAFAQVWGEPRARRFAIFVFVSMLAYSAQDLILEPFAGLAFGFTPGQSTTLSSTQHTGALLGMIAVALAVSGLRLGSLLGWTIGGCVASALALLGVAVGGLVGPSWPLAANVFLLGLANGMFAVAAIGSMMGLVGSGHGQREGVRMGLWGAAQAVAFGLGGLLGAMAVDVVRLVIAAPAYAYGLVFAAEAIAFIWAAGLALRVDGPAAAPRGVAAAAT